VERAIPLGRVVTSAALAASAVALAACGSQSATNSSDNLVQGKQLFVSRCGSCHTLARANTKGTIGPNLDDAFRESLSEGFGRSVVRGVVAEQIKVPNTHGAMPADLVTGDEVTDVAAYVASTVAKGGKDTGPVGEAVKAVATSGKPAVEADGSLEIDADPSGQLAYVTKKATAKPGPITIKMGNKSSVQHDIAITGNGVSGKGEVVGQGGTSEFKVGDLPAGSYTYYCTVPGHRAAGMEGTLTVR
jgi:mono/diheme cytochrome c family protein